MASEQLRVTVGEAVGEHSARVLAAVGDSKQVDGVTADDVRLRVAEHPLGGRVELDHLARRVQRDDAVERGFDHGLVARDHGLERRDLDRALDRQRRVRGKSVEHVQLLVVRASPRDRLVDGDDPVAPAAGALERHEDRVVGVPGLARRVAGRIGRLDVRRDVGLDVDRPVERARRDVVDAAPQERRVQQRHPARPRSDLPEQHLARFIAAVDGADPVVVGLGPVEVDDDGLEPERLRDGPRDRLHHLVESRLAPDGAGHVQQAVEVRERRRRGVVNGNGTGSRGYVQRPAARRHLPRIGQNLPLLDRFSPLISQTDEGASRSESRKAWPSGGRASARARGPGRRR